MVHVHALRVLVACLAVLTATGSCAHKPPPPARRVEAPPPPPAPRPVRPAPPPPRLVKLVVLPLEKLALPGTADDINGLLAKVRLPGTADPIVASTSMESIQVQSECTQPTDECYLKIARLVEADRILWAEIEKSSKAKKRKVSLRIILFDAERHVVVGQSTEAFAGAIPDTAIERLIANVVDGSRAPAAETPPAAGPLVRYPAAPQTVLHSTPVPAPAPYYPQSTYAPASASPQSAYSAPYYPQSAYPAPSTGAAPAAYPPAPSPSGSLPAGRP